MTPDPATPTPATPSFTIPSVGTDSLAAALAYASVGWRVIPIPPGSKHPKEHPAWEKAGTTDTDRIRHWWTNAPNHGIGILTGPESGIWVLDVDVSGDKTGDETLAELEDAYSPLPPTYEVITGSGGRHLYFAWPSGHDIRNSASDLGPGLDVRGAGGQVLAPPTVHPNGQRYEHEASSPLLLAPAPGWLVSLVEHQERERTSRSTANAGTPGTRPGDQWAATITWAQLLEPDGWTFSGTGHGGEERWTRPGKDKREGISATVGYKGSDVLKVFTSSVAALRAEETYTKLGYLAATRHDGDHSAAAKALRERGFGAADPISLDDVMETARGGAGAGTHAAALEASKEPPVTPWPPPPGFPPPTPTPTFPVDALPSWVAAQVSNVTRQIRCDPMLPALFGLGALSVASLGHIHVAVRAGQTDRSTGLYLVGGGPPGAGKSPAMKFMFAPVRTHEQHTISASAAKVIDYDRQVAKLQKTARDSLSETDAKAAVVELAGLEQPSHGELITSDFTPERVASLLKENDERFAIVSDEADALVIDRYGERGAPKKLGIFLQGFTGEPVAVHRVKAPTIRLQHPLVAIVTGAQPEALEAAMADPEWRTRGMGARFLTAVTHWRRTNIDIDLDVWDSETADRYNTTLLALCRRWSSWPAPATLQIEPAGRRRFTAWATELQDRGDDGDLEGEDGWVSKLRTSTLRIAALLAAAGEGAEGAVGVPLEITDGNVANAIRIADFFIESHLHEVGAGEADARRLLASLVKIADADAAGCRATGRATPRFVARRDVGRRGPRGLRTVEETTPALIALIEAGLVRLVLDGQVGNLQVTELVKRARAFEIHPDAEEHLVCATARDARDTLGVEGNEMAESAGAVARVARVAEEGILTPPFIHRSGEVIHSSAAPTPYTPSTSATRATGATGAESRDVPFRSDSTLPEAEVEAGEPAPSDVEGDDLALSDEEPFEEPFSW